MLFYYTHYSPQSQRTYLRYNRRLFGEGVQRLHFLNELPDRGAYVDVADDEVRPQFTAW